MRAKKILYAVLITLLTVLLVLLVGSRDAEKAAWPSSLSSGADAEGYEQTSVPDLDNDTSNIAQTEISPTPVPTPKPTVYKPDIDINSWEYILVNQDHSIGGYVPSVVTIDDTAQFFDSRAVDALESFLQAARDSGFTPYINTAYRPYSSQEYIFNGKASQIAWGGEYTYEEAVEMAKAIVAYPGTSEHQTGLCCDITDQYYNIMNAEEMDQDFLNWLKDNCTEFGFILRYPANKESITGWNEPWHFRYVGVEVAEYMTENNLCLEEFWDLYE